MGRSRNDALMRELALAIACGDTVKNWSTRADVNTRTAYNWARSEPCRQAVRQIREKTIDRVVGRLVRHSLKAVSTLAEIASKGQGERASRSKCGVARPDIEVH